VHVIPLFVIKIPFVSLSSRQRPPVTNRATIVHRPSAGFPRRRAFASPRRVVSAFARVLKPIAPRSRASSPPALARRARSRVASRHRSFAHLNDDRPPVPTASLVTLGGGTLKSLPGLMLIARALAKSAGSACVDARASVTRQRAVTDVAKRRARARDISRWYQSRSADDGAIGGVARAGERPRNATRRTRRARRDDETANDEKNDQK
jgi:hypothetical protein